MTLLLNGRTTNIDELGDPTIAGLIAHLALKADRIAVERNGELAPRSSWSSITLTDGDKIEIVHFVGGGAPPPHRLH